LKATLLIHVVAAGAIMVAGAAGHASPFISIAQSSFDGSAIAGANGILTALDVLTLQVDPVTGLTLLKNETPGSVTITGYRLGSTTGALNVAGWNPISDGNELPAQFLPDNGIEDGLDWEAAPNPSANELLEWYLTGESTLLVGQQLSLGNAVNPAGVPALQFTYSLSDETSATGVVRYEAISLVPRAGDYNDNGVVDAADYVVWRKNLNQSVSLPNDLTPGTVMQEDYDVWRANFGKAAAPAAAALGLGSVVPEPETIGLLLIAAVAGVGARFTWCPARRSSPASGFA
jgi:hypothetical protein